MFKSNARKVLVFVRDNKRAVLSAVAAVAVLVPGYDGSQALRVLSLLLGV